MSNLIDLLGPEAANDSVAEHCSKLMALYDLTAEEFRIKWEAFAINRQDETILNESTLRELQTSLQRELERKASNRKPGPTATPRHMRPKIGASPGQFFDYMTASPVSKRQKTAPTTPRPNSAPGSMSPPSTGDHNSRVSPSNLATGPPSDAESTPFRSRKDPGKTLHLLNGHLSADRPVGLPSSDRFRFTANVDPKKFAFRYMHQQLGAVGETLDDQIETFTELVVRECGVDPDSIGNPAVSGHNEIVAVGRVVAETEGERMNHKSVVLETSRHASGGMRVVLDLDRVPSWFFFPGQIVALRGRNLLGTEFVVSQIIDLPLLPGTATPRATLKSICQRQDQRPTSVLVAAGPFTSSQDLNFEPLQDLVDLINRTGPDTVVLIGPFVDYSHRLVRTGDFEVYEADRRTINDNATLDDLFRDRVTSKLLQITDPNITVALVPSVKDTAASHACFPQAPLDRATVGLPKQFRLLPNPATFSVNEVVFSVTSTDSVQDIVRTSVRKTDPKSPAPVSNMTLALQSILRQRRLYPVYPASMTKLSSVSLDLPYVGLSAFTQATPDVVITPSVSSTLAQIVNNVVMVSPGLLTRGTSGGSYAMLTIQPPSLEGDDDLVSHRVWERARVDIKRI